MCSLLQRTDGGQKGTVEYANALATPKGPELWTGGLEPQERVRDSELYAGAGVGVAANPVRVLELVAPHLSTFAIVLPHDPHLLDDSSDRWPGAAEPSANDSEETLP